MRQIALRSFSFVLFNLLALVPVLAFAAEPVDEAASSVDEGESGGGGSFVSPAIAESRGGFDIEVSGYLRSSLSYIDYVAEESDFIGRNQGFGLASARLEVEGRRDRAGFVISADGAVAVMDSANTSQGRLAFRLADAFASYDLMPGLVTISLGQQKVPFDSEGILSSAELPFINRSVWQRGVQGVEGFNVDGLGIDREVGLSIFGDRISLGEGPVALSYSMALTNGNSPAEAFNENRSLAAYARVEGHFEEIVTVGVAGYHNQRTFGALPDLLNERHIGLTADVAARFAGAWLRLDFVQVQADYPEVAVERARTSIGGGASLGYRCSRGFEGAYRLAFYDPTWKYAASSGSLAAQLENNELMHHTFGLAWVPENHPLGVQLNYTLARENSEREVRNDRVELLGRLVF